MVKGVSKIVLAASLTAILSVCTVPDAHVSKMINCIDCSVVHAAVTRLETPSIVNLENKYEGIEITWSSVSNAEGYNIYRRRKSSMPWTLVATVAATGETKITDPDTGKDGGLYTYMIQAYSGDLLSKESQTKTLARVNVTRAKLKITYKQKAARNMYKFINDFRQSSEAWAWNSANNQKVYMSGLNRLAYDYNLEKIAMVRAAEIAVKFAHERPNGKECFSAYNERGYIYTAAGENIAYGYKTARAAFNAFAETNNYYSGQGHRRNMLSKDYNVCAIGHVKVNGVHYWVQEFANTSEDSDYTKTRNSTATVTLDIASEDVPSYDKALKKLEVKYTDIKPAKISILTAEAASRSVTLTYERSIGAVGYEVYRSNSKNGGYKRVARIQNQDKLIYTDKKLSRSKKYYYYIVPYRLAHDSYIYGKKSKVVMIKTQ